MQFSIVWLKYARPYLTWKYLGWEHMLLQILHIPFNSTFPDVQSANSIGTDAPPYHERCRLLMTSQMVLP